MPASRPAVPQPASPPRRRKAARPIQRAIRRYFGFSRRETSGFVVLLLLMLLWLGLPYLLRPALPTYNPAPDQQQLNTWAAELAARRTTRPTYASRYPRRAPVTRVALAPFDPNQLTETDWEARGVPRYVARRMINYRTVIGGFRAKEQIRRTYGLDDAIYTRLAPYILLPDQLPPREARTYADNRFGTTPERKPFGPNDKSRFPRKPTRLAAFDLNAADTTQLMQIRGIGRGYARRIVEYRQRLGGFHSKEQTAEIYALRDAPDLVDSLRKYTFVAPSFTPTPLDLNNASFEVLQAHPYMGKRLARVVVAFRQQHGPFRQPSDLRQIRILDQATYDKLVPYLVLK
ncbi:helix-hairpin-helix domain-containing protein [Hymenobacter sediminis]|uniref:ComEA family DNA-binding protein n=1 Tax=Hymenobacter sediminis TaxID=2218621 RepID=UPI000DA6B8D3|nr:helix-hairpin-helix domain-containing protein [Hymenobacter sediminis]RPD50146.1 helix-hairpin-helix domain-containing protein [Hymenobacter sediminis]